MKAILKNCLIAIFALVASGSSYAGEVSVHFSPNKETSYTVDGEVSVHYSESFAFIPSSKNALSVYKALAEVTDNDTDIHAELIDKDSGETEPLVFKKVQADEAKVYFSATRSDDTVLVWEMELN